MLKKRFERLADHGAAHQQSRWPRAARWTLVALALGTALAVAVWAGSQRGGSSNAAARAGAFTVSWSTEAVTLTDDGQVVQVEAVLSEPAAEPLTIEYEARGSSGDRLAFGAEFITIGQGEDRGVLELRYDAGSAPPRERLIVDLTGGPGVTVVRPRRLTVTIQEVPSEASPATTTTSRVADAPPGPVELPVTSVLAQGSLSETASVPSVSAVAKADSLLLLAVASATSTSPTPLPVAASGDVEWELVETSMREGGARRLSIFRASTAGGDVETTLEFAGSQRVVNWIVLQVESTITTGNGAGAVRQIAGNSADGFETSAEVQLEPMLDGSTAIGFFFMGANEAEGGPGFETLTTVGPRKRLLMAIVGTEETVATAEWPNRAHWKAIALELVPGP